MHVVLDISSLPYGTGVSVYTKELVAGLNRVGHQHKFTLIAGALKQKKFFENWFEDSHLGENFKLKIVPIPPKLQNVLWTKLNLAIPEFWIGDGEVYHSLDWSLGIGSKPTLLTIHDLFFWKNPELQKHPYEKYLIRRIKKARDHNCPIIAVSQTTKNDLVELANYPEELVEVIYEASPHEWKKTSQVEIDRVTRKYNLNNDYLLAVSTIEPRKNYPRLISAYENSGVKNDLIIIGKVGWQESVEKRKGIRFLGFVDENDLVPIWQGAKGLLYPSLYEGFGLPILQSFKLEVPVLTSNLGSMKEIGGNAIVDVDPYNIDSIATGIANLVKLNSAEIQELVNRGVKRASEFSWDITATKTMKLYERIKSI